MRILRVGGSKSECLQLISDVNMPVLDGIGLLRRCRAESDFKDLPFLMISGESNQEFVAIAGESGAYDYIVKPFSCSVLRNRVDGIFERLRDPEEGLYRAVERLKEDGNPREALQKIEQLEKTVGSLKPKWLNLKGECLMEVGDMESAAASLEKALAASENFLAAHKNYAALHQKLGNTEKVIEALEKADSISPRDTSRKITLGKLFMKAGSCRGRRKGRKTGPHCAGKTQETLESFLRWP